MIDVIVAHISNPCNSVHRCFHLERPQFCHHVALHADRLFWYPFFLVSGEEQMLFQLHCDSGILLDLPSRFAFEQLKVDRVSERDKSARVAGTYRSVCMVQEVLQRKVGFSKRLLENCGQRRHGMVVVVNV